MFKGDFEWGTSCSNRAAVRDATTDGNMYVVRILDWGLHKISKLHQYPLITVCKPKNGVAFANIGWVGFLGCVSGINASGITIGEMGYGDPPNETLYGTPMPFVLRDVLSYSESLSDVKQIIQRHKGTASFGYLMTDGKTGDSELYVRDPDRFLVFRAGQDLRDGDEYFPAIENVVYGGHYDERMTTVLNKHRGNIAPELLMNNIIPEIVMKSNFQNVVYDPKNLVFWVNNAFSAKRSAKTEPYTRFDFAEALK